MYSWLPVILIFVVISLLQTEIGADMVSDLSLPATNLATAATQQELCELQQDERASV